MPYIFMNRKGILMEDFEVYTFDRQHQHNTLV